MDDYLIDVEVKDGVVVLDGLVGSLAEKTRAISDGWVADVLSVDGSGLDIDWTSRDELRRKSLYVARTDEEIEEAVEKTLAYDPRVASVEPDVEVHNGTVILSGVVGDLKARRAAEEDARNVIGVWRVRNHLKVRPKSVPEDAVLEKRVLGALANDPYVDRFDVKVAVDEGWVYLSGDVDNSFERNRAGRVAEGVRDAVAVVNYLDYDYTWTWKPDREIREDVRDQLFWSPYVSADQVSVNVDGGVVTLTGLVDTWSERDVAEKNAWDGGAKDVHNELDVTYHTYGPYRPDRPYHYGPPYWHRPFPPKL